MTARETYLNQEARKTLLADGLHKPRGRKGDATRILKSLKTRTA
jgi:hypothetical protein